MNQKSPSTSPRFPTRLVILGLLAAFAIFLIIGILSRLHARSERHATSEAQRAGAVTVRVAQAQKLASTFDFSLPGTAEPLQDTVIYARTNGYLRERLVDLGDQVKAGQLLARIDTPEVTAQLNQSRASLQQSKAASELARITLQRQKDLAARSVISRQDYDNSQASATQASANVSASDAAVANLEAQQGFSEVTAPFAGTITERNFDLGALISNGSAASLFRLSDTSVLRIYVNVPQTYSGSISHGMNVELSTPEGLQATGQVTRRAGAIDPASRTERVEVQIPNRDGKLLPGTYLNVKFQIAPAAPTVVIPANALDIRRDGPRVAVVETGEDKKSVLKYRPVKIGRDLGTTTELSSGLQGGETIVLNPTSDLTDNMEVLVAKEAGKQHKQQE